MLAIERAVHASAALYLKPGQTNTWITPRAITEALCPFDLDPCAAIGQPWKHAAHNYTEADNGLTQPWFGRVWMNPPYGKDLIPAFVDKFVKHGNGTALVFPRTETKWFQTLASAADLLFLKAGRIHFNRLDGSKSGAFLGSVFVAIGKHNVDALKQTNWVGQYLVHG